MSGDGRDAGLPTPVESVDFLETLDAPAAGDDALDLGRPPGTPWSMRTRRLVAAGAVVVAGAVTAVALTTHGGGHPDQVRAAAQPSAPAATTPSAAPRTGGGALLVTVAGHDALQPPTAPGRDDAVDPIVLDPAPDVVAALRATLPGLRDVHGGRIPSDLSQFGVYFSASYTGHSGPVQVTIYSVRSPGTTFGSDQFVSRTRSDTDDFSVRTDVSVFTGTGWWVHAVSLGPDDPATVRTGEIARLLPIARNPALVAS